MTTRFNKNRFYFEWELDPGTMWDAWLLPKIFLKVSSPGSCSGDDLQLDLAPGKLEDNMAIASSP